MLFNIICMEEIDSIFGKIKIGDIINTVNYENLSECKRFIRNQYGPKGEDIKVKIILVNEV